MGRLVVDGMNVIGSRPTGWWRDRAGAARALHERLRRLAAATGDEVTLVLDGPPPSDLEEGEHGGVRVLYARRRGRDGADDRIVELAAADPSPGSLVVVTSDRELRRRLDEVGVATSGPRALLARLDRLEAGG